MEKKIIIIYYFLLIFSDIYLGNFKFFDSISIRVPLSLLGFLLIVFFPKPTMIKKHLFLLILPLVYLFFHIISMYFDDKADLLIFFKEIVLSRFFFTYIIVGVTIILIPDFIKINDFINIILVTATFNSIIIFGQLLEMEVFLQLTEFVFKNKDDADAIVLITEYDIYPGVIGRVYSGYILVVSIPLVLYKMYLKNNRIIYYNVLLLNIVSLTVLEQRFAFYLVLISIFIYIYFFVFKDKFRLFLYLFLFFGLIVYEAQEGFFMFLEESDSRLLDMEDEGRILIFINSLIYILDNPLLGGFSSFYIFNEYQSPHNLFLNAWIRSGVFGFIAVLIVFFSIIKNTIKILFANKINFNPQIWFLSLSLLNVMLISITHNKGIATGNGITFVFITIFVIYRSNTYFLINDES